MSVRLSIIMPNFNHGQFLESRIRSLLEQLSLEDELIVVDDASFDHSSAIVKQYAAIDRRVRLIQNQQNMGPAQSANRALQEAKGTYISWLASDDVLLPGFITESMNVLSRHPEIGIVSSNFVEWEETTPIDEISNQPILENVHTTQLFPKKSIDRTFWTTNFWIPGNTAITKRDHLITYGQFQPTFGHLCDWFLFHSIALFEGAAYIPKNLALFRKNNLSYSGQFQNSIRKKRHLAGNIINFLVLPENKELRIRFRKAGLCRFLIRKNVIEFIKKPLVWDLLFAFFSRAIQIKLRKLYFRGKSLWQL